MNTLKKFWNNESGIGTIEILLILVVLILIAVIFGKTIVKWFNNLIGRADTEIENFNPQPNDPSQ